MSQPDFHPTPQLDYGPHVPNSLGSGVTEPQNSHYYGYPPLPSNYHYPAYRDNFGNFHPSHFQHPVCPPQQSSYANFWPIKQQSLESDNQLFNNSSNQQLPQQSIKSEQSTPSTTTPTNSMELAHLHDFKPVGMSLLNLPTSQPNQPNIPPQLLSQFSSNSSSSMDSNSNITLWQFLLEMLTSGEHPELIQWTNNEGEFKLLDAEAVARLWGVKKGKHQMNYDKLSRALRYYYDKNIIKKVNGQKFVYRFVIESMGSNTDMLSYTMQRSMGIHPNGQNNSMVPPSTSLPRPQPTNHSIMNNDHGFYRRSNDATQGIKTENDGSSTSRPLTVTNNTSTPSPINSSCSPGSSSGVSSASNLSDVYANQQHPSAHLAQSGHSSRPSSTASTSNTHNQQQPNSRKRKRENDGNCVEKIKIEPPSSFYYNNGANENVFGDAQSPNNGTGLSRRARPKPLDLTAVSNVNNTMGSINNNNAINHANNAMNNLVAAASPLFQNSPALLNIYAATLSANFMQSQASPLSTFTAAALASPLHFAAAMNMASSPTMNPNNNNNLSMFGNSLSALTTPIPTRTPQQPQNTNHGQFFQFPPSSQASANFALAAALLRSPGFHSPFLTAMGFTPNAQTNGSKFNMSPNSLNDALKTPVVPSIREV